MACLCDLIVPYVNSCNLRSNNNNNNYYYYYYSHFTGHLLSRYRRISECLYSIVNGEAGRYAPYRPA